MDSCKGKRTYSNPNHCSMMELGNMQTRPPWRPAASSMTANMDLEVPPPQWSATRTQKTTQLTIPPQYMSATDLLAAMPKRQRMPKPQTLSNVLTAEEPRVHPKTPWAPSLTSQIEAADFGKPSKRSSDQTPNSVLDRAASDAKPRSTTGKHGSQLPSPPSPARSLVNSPTQSERDFGGSQRNFDMASSGQKKSRQMSPGIAPQGSSPPRSNNRASPASPAGSSRSPEHSPTMSRHRNTASANEVPSTNPRSRCSSRSRMNTTDSHHHNVPSRGTTCMSACSSVTDGLRASRRCSPPTPPRPSSPPYSPY